MNIKMLLLVSAMAGFLSINSIAEPKIKSGQTELNLEPLYGIQFSKNSVSIQVKSTGCTKPEHFTIQLQKGAVTPLKIIRNKPDRCRAMPKIISVVIGLESEGVTRYVLLNNFVSH